MAEYYYISEDGNAAPTGDGTFENPWDLEYFINTGLGILEAAGQTDHWYIRIVGNITFTSGLTLKFIDEEPAAGYFIIWTGRSLDNQSDTQITIDVNSQAIAGTADGLLHCKSHNHIFKNIRVINTPAGKYAFESELAAGSVNMMHYNCAAESCGATGFELGVANIRGVAYRCFAKDNRDHGFRAPYQVCLECVAATNNTLNANSIDGFDRPSMLRCIAYGDGVNQRINMNIGDEAGCCVAGTAYNGNAGTGQIEAGNYCDVIIDCVSTDDASGYAFQEPDEHCELIRSSHYNCPDGRANVSGNASLTDIEAGPTIFSTPFVNASESNFYPNTTQAGGALREFTGVALPQGSGSTISYHAIGAVQNKSETE